MNQADLLACARTARDQAHAPYSQFRVGAAVLARDGRVFHGCNVENAAYPLCTCAERTALCAAVAAGCRPGDFVRIAIVADTATAVSPCGACRQIMMELGGTELAVTLSNLHGDVRETTVGALLPDAFRLPEKAERVLEK
jgi:cytidine deaminase